jgi:hypothetical protein
LPIIFELSHSNDLSTWDGDQGSPNWRRLVDDIRYLIGPEEQPAEIPVPKSKGFLLAEDKSEKVPAIESSPFLVQGGGESWPSPETAAAPGSSAETEQTSFYTKAEADLHSRTGEVHCLELGSDDHPLARYPIGMLGAKLGRAAPADITFSDKRISRRHCDVEVRDGQMWVTDLQSTNGTFVDGQRIDLPTVLLPDAELMIGDVILTHRVRSHADLN